MSVVNSDLWVFGYGSLIWKPGFPFVTSERATLVGFHRALCVFSVRYRGSSELPGLVFGLDAGGFCNGVAFRIAAQHASATIGYLRDREQVTGVYRAEKRLVDLGSRGGEVQALVFTANRAHPQYAGRLPTPVQARIVRASRGISGPNVDYVLSTAHHLADLGIRDRSLEHISAVLGRGPFPQPRRDTYPRYLVPPLPPDRALRCAYQRNLSV